MMSAALLSKERGKVALRCLDVIAEFTPERAAEKILFGCVSILNTPQ
jgi:hypothetical protein